MSTPSKLRTDLNQDEFGFALGYLEQSIIQLRDKLDRPRPEIAKLREDAGQIFSDLNKAIDQRRAKDAA